ncbi:unnamed protein product (macronuclear) [Paramecium tetraurelia]|uniref:Ubiquitin-like domain-containing protein n=1 Tax=Paramecium tetraurelia TaxID=5888 RepID=A0CPU4_PARTE|nr:uncharacterized protein GSPATT00009203001 [Paramecium tetraurelia]CAK72811.1 unnamed protein product [Paramecium tetraurelia]|eukprot:XP_001440208.1 hypothetical protein (macronuclear) [Paramecium tetraurelia strain d4-2]
MGVCSNKTKELNYQEDVHNKNQIDQQYLHLLDIQNPVNVNHKFDNHFTLIQNKYTGIGIKLTNQYTTNLSRSEWELMQNQFWGRVIKSYKDSYKDSTHWSSIRNALLQDDECTSHFLILESSIAILMLSKLKMINNTIQLLISDKQVFQVPVFVINEPISWNNEHLVLNFEKFSLKVICYHIQVSIRSSKLPKDFLIETESTSKVLEIKQKILEVAKEKTCRLYLNGRELIDKNYLGNYNITSGTVLNQLHLDNSSFFVIIFQKCLVLIYIMHKQKEQILFKCHLQHQKPELEDITTFNINKIIETNKYASIFELILDNCKFIMDTSFCLEISSQFIPISIDCLNNCNIVTLQNIPKIDTLKRLTLDYNFIQNSELIHLKFYQNKLLSLSIMQNQLDFSDSSLLQEFYLFDKLLQLSIAGNYIHITEYESIIARDEIFKNMKNLVFLDTIAKGEYLSTCMENQYKDQKQEQAYLSRLDIINWKAEMEYNQKIND